MWKFSVHQYCFFSIWFSRGSGAILNFLPPRSIPGHIGKFELFKICSETKKDGPTILQYDKNDFNRNCSQVGLTLHFNTMFQITSLSLFLDCLLHPCMSWEKTNSFKRNYYTRWLRMCSSCLSRKAPRQVFVAPPFPPHQTAPTFRWFGALLLKQEEHKTGPINSSVFKDPSLVQAIK